MTRHPLRKALTCNSGFLGSLRHRASLEIALPRAVAASSGNEVINCNQSKLFSVADEFSDGWKGFVCR